MDDSLIEQLLNEGESSSLDFKRDQYEFDGASDEVKSEILKDILAFANSWRRSTAYILIGVEEVKGGRSRPVGVQRHLDDAKLQQFVNSKTQKPVSFGYQVQLADRVELGIISVPVQERPIFLLKDFGRLKKDTVYLRRGSSTDTASPDEIAKIALSASQAKPPKMTVTARVLNAYRGEFVISVVNTAGAGVARAPYLELHPPAPFSLATYGLDGNSSSNHGLPLLPQGSGSGTLQFAGTSEVVLHAGTIRDVTRIEWGGPQGQVPAAVEIPYLVGAEGAEVVRDKITITLRT